jgi:hypothetical protein
VRTEHGVLVVQSVVYPDSKDECVYMYKVSVIKKEKVMCKCATMFQETATHIKSVMRDATTYTSHHIER